MILRAGQIALRLDDEEVGGQADVEAALLGIEALLRELARGLRRAVPREAALDLQRRRS